MLVFKGEKMVDWGKKQQVIFSDDSKECGLFVQLIEVVFFDGVDKRIVVMPGGSIA